MRSFHARPLRTASAVARRYLWVSPTEIETMPELRPGLFAVNLLEGAAMGRAADGVVHSKTVPFGVLAQASEGRYELFHSGRKIEASEGAVLFAPPHVPLIFVHHATPNRTQMSYRFVHFSCALAGGVDFLNLIDPPDLLTGADADSVGRCIDELVTVRERAVNPIHELALEHQLGATIAAILSSRSALRAGARKLLDEAQELGPLMTWIRAHIAEPLDVASIARHGHMSKATLHRKFLAVVGTPPMEYVKQMRLDEAARLLLRGRIPLANLAATVGFANPYHLSREFKSRFGVSPTHYAIDPFFLST